MNTGNADIPDEWTVLVADDVSDVHLMTKLALDGMAFSGGSIRLECVGRGDEAVDYLAHNPETDVVIIDLVMEEEDSGLRTIEKIREGQGNWWTRIIVQSGGGIGNSADEFILNYDVDGFIEKGIGGVSKLRAAVVMALRARRDILRAKERS